MNKINITIKPTKKQMIGWKAFDDGSFDVVIFGGGAGGGKSWFICESRLARALAFPGYKSFIARKELKRLMATTFLTFLKVMQYHKIPASAWTYNGKYNYLEFYNGSRIDFLDVAYKPATDPLFERFGSLEYTDGAFDEIGEIHADAFDILKSRVNRHMNKEFGLHGTVIGSLNPSDNWVKTTYFKPYEAIRDNLRAKGKYDENTMISFIVGQGEHSHKVVFIESLYKDNPFTADAYEKTLGAIRNEKNRARLKDGDWNFDNDPTRLVTKQAIFDIFDKLDSLGDDAKPSDYWITSDVARYGSDKAIFYVWRRLQVVKKVVFGKSSINLLLKTLNQLRREYQVRASQCIADDDGVGGGLVDMGGIIGFVNGSKALNGENYANLKTQCAFLLAEKIENGEIGVNDDVFTDEEKALVIQELKLLKEDDWDKDGKLKLIKKEKMKEILGGRSPDYLDTFIMRMLGELEQSNNEFVTIL